MLYNLEFKMSAKLYTTDSGARFWISEGRYHRENGPAIIWSNGTREWYLFGVKIAYSFTLNATVFYKGDGTIYCIADGDERFCPIEWLFESMSSEAKLILIWNPNIFKNVYEPPA